MFQIRVQKPAEEDAGEAKQEHEDASDLLLQNGASFRTGNPQVRVSSGKLRFYRPDRPYTLTSAAQLPQERNTLLCIVSVPSHMSPVELLEFLAGFRSQIVTVRVLKDPERCNCMALIQFSAQEDADQFFLVRIEAARSNRGSLYVTLTMCIIDYTGAQRDVLQLDRAGAVQDRICAQH